jgi:hypothetical protein
MHGKHQFQTAAQRRTFFDRKILRYGHSATVSMGKIIPKDWAYVRLRVVEKTEKNMTISLEMLLRDTNGARYTKANQTSGYNT